ncbi:MAG: response regulator [Vicinamibacterales bacterium]
MDRPLRLLLVEDLPADAELMLAELHRGGLDADVERVDREDAYLAALNRSLDIVLSDFNVPGFGALRALELLKERAPEVPFIVVSGSIGEETAVELLRNGASDYLLKDRMGRLPQAVRRAIDQRRLEREKRQLEDQFRQAQKMEAIGQLAGGVAHDFNNLLTVIQGYVELLEERLVDDTRSCTFLGELRHASVSAASLTRQLLAFSRRQILEPRVLDLAEAVRAVEPIVRRLIGEHITVHVHADARLRILADSGQIEQIILNLAVNARDAMPDGGRLDIRVSRDSNRRKAVLEVADTGVGMDEQTQSRIFEPFFTTKGVGRGTGLGLATVYGIVQQSGGRIDVQSAPGRGTTFALRFPEAEGAEAPSPQQSAPATLSGSEQVLVVEDDALVRELVRTVLERAGYGVTTTATPGEAHAVAADRGDTFDLLITDVVLPEMNGRMLAAQLLARHPDLHVLYMSGYIDTVALPGGIIDGKTPFLRKPFTPETLLRKVRQTLD